MELLKQSTVEYRYLDTKIFNFTANIYQLQIAYQPPWLLIIAICISPETIILVNLYIFSLFLLGKWLNRWIDLLNDC